MSHRLAIRTRRDEETVTDAGTVTVFVVVLMAAFVMFGGLILDAGGVLTDKISAMGVAQEAARAGAQRLDLTAFRQTGTVRLAPDQAVTAARAYLAQAGVTGNATVADNTITVTVTADHHTQLLGILGLDTLTITATGSAHPAPPTETVP
ncbi:putative Flp pilus-assembly TadG-like N-terminal domain-containing protein [Frankia sp. AiPs1]|uniref:TadE/TadG family type IV pilus assembly protein n=1 Tax=Frankia sp. AiPa1 TaxID=573492 RepID=UPI00202B9B32|nr:pilus assembly protein TadG-related protein [Frankia sp. AiPa1]MCL9759311.1 pilus assembly protein TadG-related protein [Frankia sp. AiPa1]